MGKRIAALAIIFAACLWGLDGVVLRPLLYHLDVSVVVFLEHVIAFLYMIPLLIIERHELKKLKAKDWGVFFWIALFGGAIGGLAITKALFYVNFVPLSVPILIQKLQPVFAILLAMIMLRERPCRKFYFYAVLALIGSYFVTFGFDAPLLSLENKTLVAALLGLVAAFAWGSSTTFGKLAVSKVNYRVATYLRFGLTSLIMFMIILTFQKKAEFAAVTLGNIWTFVLIALTTGGVAIFIYYYGLRYVPASKATIYELGLPITAISLDFLLHHTFLSLGQLFGAIVLVFAIIMINRSKVGKN